jgi:hypothetical protein
MMPTTLCGAVQNFTMRPPPTPFRRSLRNDRANPTGCEEAEHLASFRLSYPPPDRDWLAARGIVLAAGLDPFKGKGILADLRAAVRHCPAAAPVWAEGAPLARWLTRTRAVAGAA